MVHATLPVNAEPGGGQDFAIVDLPAIERAATVVHRGSMDNVMSTIQVLAGWIEDNGYRGQRLPAGVLPGMPGGHRPSGSPNCRSRSPRPGLGAAGGWARFRDETGDG